jgi:hypothetical protein
MTCPYCGRRVGDMPDHLKKQKDTCGRRHRQSLGDQLRHVLDCELKKGEKDDTLRTP